MSPPGMVENRRLPGEAKSVVLWSLAEVHAMLLKEQTYLCSPRTMYRILAAADEVRDRSDQRRTSVRFGVGLNYGSPSRGIGLLSPHCTPSALKTASTGSA